MTVDPNARLEGFASFELVDALVSYTERLGVTRRQLFDSAGVSSTPDQLGRIAAADYVEILRAAKHLTQRDELLLLLSGEVDFSEVSLVGLIANASETMLGALMQLNRYGRLVLDIPFDGATPLSYEIEGDRHWVVDTRRGMFHNPELVETKFTYLITGPRRFLPRSHVVEVEVMHPAPSYREVYEEVWDCPIRFGAGRNAFRVEPWVAQQKVQQQPEYLLGILTEQADKRLAELKAEKPFTQEIEALVIRALHSGAVNINWVAEELSLSRQTVYRRLKAEETTFQTLLDELRQRLAKQHLRSSRWSLTETAYLLGFSELSTFTRAFKRWTGLSPGQYRDQS